MDGNESFRKSMANSVDFAMRVSKDDSSTAARVNADRGGMAAGRDLHNKKNHFGGVMVVAVAAIIALAYGGYRVVADVVDGVSGARVDGQTKSRSSPRGQPGADRGDEAAVRRRWQSRTRG
jgi:hypothetical protein